MGTWGPRPFEGDDAMGVVYEFTQNSEVKVIEDALGWVLEPNYDGVEWEGALAAAEVVAILKGCPAREQTGLHAEVMKAVEGRGLVASPELVGLAVRVCEAALAGSELQERIREFSEPEFHQKWVEAVGDLERRLRGVRDGND